MNGKIKNGSFAASLGEQLTECFGLYIALLTILLVLLVLRLVSL